MSTNLGEARVKVEVLNELPYVTKDAKRYQFDVNASVWSKLKQSQHFPPFLAEYISDNADDAQASFGAILPARRKYYVDNYLSTSAPAGSKNVITWKPTTARFGIVYDIVKELPNYSLILPGKYSTAPKDYQGPEWVDAVLPGEPSPNDRAGLRTFLQALGLASTPSTTNTTTTSPQTIVLDPELHVVNQRKVGDALWWVLESSNFLSENMPFWVTIRRQDAPATDNQTAIVLQIGLGNSEQSFDLYLSDQKPPMVIEYLNGRKSGTASATKTQTFEGAGVTLFEDQQYIQIGVMTIGGRIVFTVNDHDLVYTRYEGSNASSTADPGELKEAKISAGKIRVFGTNVKVTIDACPMTFTSVGALALDVIPVIPTITSGSGAAIPDEYYGVNEEMEPLRGRTVAQLPKEDGTSYFGVDCNEFTDSNGSVKPDGFGFHQDGKVRFKKSTDFGITSWGTEDFYVMTLNPDNGVGGADFPISIPNGSAPYFIKLKGAQKYDGSGGSAGGSDISDYVISMSETVAADEQFFIKKTASVTLYNENGRFDNSKFRQKGIRLSWGWGDSTLKQTFTGIVTSVQTSEVPGKETITLDCQDYVHILMTTPIVNSPIYDGMIMFYAAKDIANRAGMTNVVNDWTSAGGSSIEEYFLPSGYSFSQPKVYFDGKQMLYECIKFMLERPEAFGYFDEDGRLHIKKLPGGIFSSVSPGAIAARFYRNTSNPDELILDEKAVNWDYSNIFNKIVITSLDKDTRNAIVYGLPATGGQDNLMFRKPFYYDQPALGDFDVVKSYAHDLAERVFYPIRKTGFKTVGSVSTIQPFSFITVDGDEYRLISLTRSYSIDSNDFTNEYNAEWLGGK
jgi:hypothetical protein